MSFASASDPVAIDMSAAPAQLGVGDRCEVTIAYRWPRGWKLTAQPNPSLAFAGEFVVGVPPPKDASTGEEERRIFTLSVCPTRSGAWALPRPQITVASSDGEVTAEANAVIVQVGVNSDIPVLPQARPLMSRPPAELVESHRRWWWIAGGCVVAALATLVVLARRRALIPPPTPREVFARDLKEAQSASEGKEVGALLSLALRRYAGAVWRFDGLGSTTREVSYAVRGRASDDEFRELMRLLESLDSLRWAADSLGVDAVQPLLENSERWTDGVQRRVESEETLRLERKGMAKRGGAGAPRRDATNAALTPAKGQPTLPPTGDKP
ncbi:MAG: hypothetical protein H0V44_00060 [Planctomycetes bacterium]|nr:hypothetical protein [Planctomycetota bacterium]